MFDDQQPPSNLPTSKEPAPITGKESQSGEPEDIFDTVEPASRPTAQPFGAGAPAGSADRPALKAQPTPPPSPLPQGEGGRRPDEGARSAPSAPPAIFGEKNSAAPELPAQVKEPLIGSRKVIIVVGAIVGLAVVAGILWAVFNFVRKTATPPEAAPAADIGGPGELEIPSLPGVGTTPPAEVPGLSPIPSLTPPGGEPVAQEVEPPSDSDGDGLLDEEEFVLGADPLNPDSDNDLLLDGEEVNTYTTDPLDPDTDGDGYLDGQEVRNQYNPKGEGRLFSILSE